MLHFGRCASLLRACKLRLGLRDFRWDRLMVQCFHLLLWLVSLTFGHVELLVQPCEVDAAGSCELAVSDWLQS